MDKRGIWLIVAIVGLLAVACCCLVVVTGGLSAFFISNNQSSEVFIDQYEEEIITVEPAEQPSTVEIEPFNSDETEDSQDDQTMDENGLSVELLDEMTAIEQEVESYRELPGVSELDRKTLTPDQLADRVLNDFFEDYGEEEVFLDLVELSALGFIDRDYDLYNLYISLYSEQIAGFYDDETMEMVVIQGEDFGGNERMTYAHEYTHALQDAAFDLDDGLGMDEDTCEADSEYCAAVQALVEGDATLSELIWFQQYATQKDQQDVIDFYDTYESPIFDSAPLFLQEDFGFPYNMGYEFVEALYLQGGYDAINQAFENPPVSTEQILHPELYPEENPMVVDLPDLSESLDDEWESLGANALGEWYWYLFFAKPEKTAWALTDETAASAAAGWGGDRYEVFYQADLDQIILISISEWDSATDLDEFWDAFRIYGQNRWGAVAETTDNQLLWLDSEQVVLLEQNGNQVLWLLCPDMETLELVQNQVYGY